MTNHIVFLPQRTLAWCLFILRIGIAIVFFMWTIDKFINPDHASAVFKTFYKIDNLSSYVAIILGVLQLFLVVLFAIGLYRTQTYSAILIMHIVSTTVSYSRYLDPWSSGNLLFFAAFPMLSACIVLWLLRRYDSISIDGSKSLQPHVYQ